MLQKEIIEQLKHVFSLIEGEYQLVAQVAAVHPSRDELVELLSDISETSEKLSFIEEQGEDLSVIIRKNGTEVSPFVFKAVPNGHEFSSFIIAILNFDGKGKNYPDEYIQNRIKNLKGEHTVKSYISLTCTNCPDVVQALNIISVINPNIKHQVIDGGINQEEVNSLGIMAVPAVYHNGKLISGGKSSLSSLLEILERELGYEQMEISTEVKEYDVAVVGGGPAGATAAIYSVRKGLKVALIADKIGGQVVETVGIENFTSVPQTTGKELAANIFKHLSDYPVDVLINRKLTKVENSDNERILELQTGEKISTKALIITTGATWRKLNVTGEESYLGKGVAFCAHCDGPLYKDKEVVVVGGGNSGIEAALDLSGICTKVTVIEFLENLKADNVLQEQAAKKDNIQIIKYSQVLEVIGDGSKVTAIKYKDRGSEQEKTLDTSAIFVQIGLMANSQPFEDIVEINKQREIIVDAKCKTNAKGIYAAGDVTTVPYKQIIIAMGEGAKAALTAFEERLSGVI